MHAARQLFKAYFWRREASVLIQSAWRSFVARRNTRQAVEVTLQSD